MAPEDIIAHKAYRLMKFYENNSGLIYPAPFAYEEWLEEIWLMREELHKAEKSRFKSEESNQKFLGLKTFLRSSCDSYDSVILFNRANIDSKYLWQALDDNVGTDRESLKLFLATMGRWTPVGTEITETLAMAEGEIGEFMRDVLRMREEQEPLEVDLPRFLYALKKRRLKRP